MALQYDGKDVTDLNVILEEAMAKSVRKPSALKATTFTLKHVILLSAIRSRVERDFGTDTDFDDSIASGDITWGDTDFTIVSRDSFLWVGTRSDDLPEGYLEALLAKVEYVDLEN